MPAPLSRALAGMRARSLGDRGGAELGPHMGVPRALWGAQEQEIPEGVTALSPPVRLLLHPGLSGPTLSPAAPALAPAGAAGRHRSLEELLCRSSSSTEPVSSFTYSWFNSPRVCKYMQTAIQRESEIAQNIKITLLEYCFMQTMYARSV